MTTNKLFLTFILLLVLPICIFPYLTWFEGDGDILGAIWVTNLVTWLILTFCDGE